MSISRRFFLKSAALFSGYASLGSPLTASLSSSGLPRTGVNGMRFLPESHIFTISDNPALYHHSAGVVSTPDGLVAVFRQSNQHIASFTNIITSRSVDGGKTWEEPKTLSTSSFEEDKANWVAPQTNRIKDGRILVIADWGKKLSPFDWPMLSQWQKPDRGMENYLFISKDNGKTWEKPYKIDDVGGEPSYIIELSNGVLMYTRTDSAPTDAKKKPAMPWGHNYYKSTAVFSDDGGKTFTRTVPVFDDPLIGDCEVGIAEFAPGKIMAISRVGDAAAVFGQPSRISISEDYGKTWSKPVLAPVNAHRPYLQQLANGKLFVTYRNASLGTTGTMGWSFDPREKFSYQPSSFIWEEKRCQLKKGVMEIKTEDGIEKAVDFILYPVEDDDSAVEIEATLAVKEADTHGCNISAGAWVRFEPNRVSLADRPEDGFDIDATQFHTYRILNENKRIKIFVDGQQKLDVPNEGIFTRFVHFGNRRGAKPPEDYQAAIPEGGFKPDGGGFFRNRSHSFWKAIAVNVKNRRDYAINWKWEANSGKYPDQYRRDRIIMIERNASFVSPNNGYSGWTQMPNKTIVVADYTCTNKGLAIPILRSYRISANEL